MSDDAASPDRPGSAVQTFLFVDIRGYTRFIVEQGDSAGLRLVQKFGSLARGSIEAHHGKVLGQAGDEVVAVFVSARDAIHAAVNLQSRASESNVSDPSTPLRVGIGLDTGEAVPTGDNYVGAALNLAARLCKLAGAQEILASEGVVHVAGKLEGIGYSERGSAQLKGFRDPVPVLQIVDERRGHGPRDDGIARPETLAGGETPLPIGAFLGALPSTDLVERTAEMGRAMTSADAAAGGSGRFVAISGEPGVGKTRLAQEVMLTLRNRQFLVATGRCYQLHQSVPFYPFLDALTSLYLSAPPSFRARLASRWPYVTRLLPELTAEKAPVIVSTPEEQQLLFREVTDFLQELAATTPLALLVDDLHWADGATLELLQHLARHTRAHRILLVGTYRDVEVGRHHALEAALRDLMREDLVERILLRRLEPGGSAKLIAATLGESHVSRDLDNLIHQHADGNAFFTQQLVRFLVERGDVYRKDGKWTPGAIRRIEVPESVRSVIGQRMERLSPGTQEALREAAVLGQTFSFDALQHLTGRTEADIEKVLDEGRATGLLEERAREEYAFDHALTQQTLYGELSSRRRHKLHVAAAEALERLPPDERAPLSAELAWHFLEAAQEDRAVPYALAAGDRARSMFAHREAEQQYTTVLEISEHTGNREQRIEALARRAKLFLDAFNGKRAVADYERLLEESLQKHDRPLELRARLGLAQSCYIVALDETGRDLASQAREMCESAAALADELGDERTKAEALLGTRWLGDFFVDYRVKARENAHRALEISRRLGDDELTLASELATWYDGNRAEVEARIARLVRALKERHDFHRLNTLYFSMMWANLDWAEFERAVEACDLGLRLAQEIGVPPVQYPTLKALALLELGRWGEAWASLQQEVTDADHPFGQAMQTLGLGAYYLEVRDYRRAADAYRDLLQKARMLRRAWMSQKALEGLARSLAREGELEPTRWEEIRAQLREIGLPVSETALAEVLLASGELEPALAAVRKARAAARKEDLLSDAWDAEELEIRALLLLGRNREAWDLVARAVGEVERSGVRSRAWRLLGLRARVLGEMNDVSGSNAARRRAKEIATVLGDSIPVPEVRSEFFASPEVRGLSDSP